MNHALVDRIREQCLPSLTDTAAAVATLTRSEHAELREIADLAARDPSLCRRLLLAGGGSADGTPPPVGALQACLSKLGLSAVRALAVVSALAERFGADAAEDAWWMAQWRRGLYAATAARQLASRHKIARPEEAFLIGLAMDLGVLALGRVMGEQYQAMHGRCATHAELSALERRELGLTHAQVSALIAAEWRLGDAIEDAILHHHAPAQSGAAASDWVSLLAIAGRCADVFVDADPASAHLAAQRLCRGRWGMDGRAVALLLVEIARRAAEDAVMLGIPAPAFPAALERANGALAASTLLMQQRIARLERDNSQLHSRAAVDALTGLATRGRLDEALQRECRAAAQEGRPVSLILIDIDRFKAVNDAHGHPAGDRVLGALGAVVARARRAQDTAARYGGEELALLLPGTSRLRAAAIAEHVRREIAAPTVTLPEGRSVRVTASIGVATVDPARAPHAARDLVELADQALYAAKAAGRNCIRVLAAGAAAESSTPAQLRKCA